tara:strand:- start:173 stop:397 length:225 start_codon:yes stop_codon:yes gene_type:complete
MKATLESKKEEEEKILDARERLMSGRGLRGEVLYFDDEKTWDKRRRRRSTEEEDKDKDKDKEDDKKTRSRRASR